MKILIVTDNEYLYSEVIKILKDDRYKRYTFDFRCSISNEELKKKIKMIDIKKDNEYLIKKYKKIISLHCKQIFPKELVERIECINIHPGFNPYNRGWFPHVFSIINKMPCGVTIHTMGEKIDCGFIIKQEKVEMCDWDTSRTLYNKIIDKELEMIRINFIDILEGNFQTKIQTQTQGNINYSRDLKKLYKIDLDEVLTMREAIDKLRACTHEDYDNAYIENSEGKIYLQLGLKFIPKNDEL